MKPTKSEKIYIRLTPAEKEHLRECAEENGMTISEYVRKLLFAFRIV